MSIDRVAVDTVPLITLLGKNSESAAPCFIIAATIKNPSATRKLDYAGAGSDLFFTRAFLHDELGNRYKALRFETSVPAGQVRSTSVYPGKDVSDVYVFEPPVDAAKRFTFTIQGEALDQEKDFVFSFNREDFDRNKKPASKEPKSKRPAVP